MILSIEMVHTGEVRVAGERRAAVPRQLDLRHHQYEAARGVLDHLPHLRASCALDLSALPPVHGGATPIAHRQQTANVLHVAHGEAAGTMQLAGASVRACLHCTAWGAPQVADAHHAGQEGRQHASMRAVTLQPT